LSFEGGGQGQPDAGIALIQEGFQKMALPIFNADLSLERSRRVNGIGQPGHDFGVPVKGGIPIQE